MFENVDDKLDAWELIFSNVINQHAPIVEKRVKRKKEHLGWIAKSLNAFEQEMSLRNGQKQISQ